MLTSYVVIPPLATEPDHSLAHLFHLGIGSHSGRCWVRIKDDLEEIK